MKEGEFKSNKETGDKQRRTERTEEAPLRTKQEVTTAGKSLCRPEGALWSQLHQTPGQRSPGASFIHLI